MDCISYNKGLQDKLEVFFELIYASRGVKLKIEGVHADIRNIEGIYQVTGGDFLLLIDQENVIGAIGLTMIDKENGIGEIKRFNVLSLFQGKGYGRLLMAHLLREAAAKGLQKLRLDTTKKSTKAISLYHKFGFYEIERYNENPFAEIFMEITLKSSITNVLV